MESAQESLALFHRRRCVVNKSLMEQTINSAAAARPRISGVAWPTILLAGILALAIAASTAAALVGGLPYWGSVIINFFCLYLSTHVIHEAVHRNISGVQTGANWLNDALGTVYSFFLFLPFSVFRAVHLVHHRTTNDPDLDCDMWVARKNPVWVALSCCTLIIGYELHAYKLVRRGLAPKSIIWHIWIQRMVSITLILIAFLAGYGTEAMVLWFLSALLVLPAFSFFFAYIVHHPHDTQDRYQSSRVWLAKSPWAQQAMTLLLMGQNYHLLHHLYPRVPFYAYPSTFRDVRPQLEREGAAIRTISL